MISFAVLFGRHFYNSYCTITANNIVNYTTAGNLMIDISFGIRYETYINKAELTVNNVLSEYENVLNESKLRVVVNNLGPNGIELLVLHLFKC